MTKNEKKTLLSKLIKVDVFWAYLTSLKDYESATGAQINYDKTVGLWLGKWKGRSDDPFHEVGSEDTKKIKWTNKNVKYAGIYVGNEQPDSRTFDEIVPKIKKRLHFWKPLALPLLAKSKVIEMQQTFTQYQKKLRKKLRTRSWTILFSLRREKPH